MTEHNTEELTRTNPSVSQLLELHEATLAISSELDLSRLLQRIVEVARALTRSRYAALGIVGPDGLIEQFLTSGLSETERELLGRGLEDVQGILGYLVGELMRSDPRGGEGNDIRNLYRVGQNTTRLLLAAGDVVIAWLLLRQAEVARAALDAGASARDQDFYQGKIAAASFFARTVLPRIAAERQVAEATDNGLMDLPESAF